MIWDGRRMRRGGLDDLEEEEEKVTEGEEEKEKEGEEEKEKEEEVAEAEGFESGGIPKEKGQVWLERVMVKVKVTHRQVIWSSGGWWPQPLDPSLAPEQKAQCRISCQCACKHWSRISAGQDAGRPSLCRWASCRLQVEGVEVQVLASRNRSGSAALSLVLLLAWVLQP